MLEEALEYLQRRNVTQIKLIWLIKSKFLIINFQPIQKQDPSFTYELIIVDDGSRDKTSKVGEILFISGV